MEEGSTQGRAVRAIEKDSSWHEDEYRLPSTHLINNAAITA